MYMTERIGMMLNDNLTKYRLLSKRILFFVTVFALFFRFCYLPVSAAPRAQAVDDNVVIVIDPGHGGENRGADEYGEPIEKDMTLVTALAMRDELSKYDNVTVFLTRTDDRDMELEERAQFAQDVGADFLFSLHYNACESHKRFGSEILLSLTHSLILLEDVFDTMSSFIASIVLSGVLIS